MADELDLTEEQLTAIEEIRANLRVAIVARHWIARNLFLALLTDDQLAKLERLENDGHVVRPLDGDRGPNRQER